MMNKLTLITTLVLQIGIAQASNGLYYANPEADNKLVYQPAKPTAKIRSTQNSNRLVYVEESENEVSSIEYSPATSVKKRTSKSTPKKDFDTAENAPILEFAAQKIEQVTSLNKPQNFISELTSGKCLDCDKNATSPRFQQCTSQNNYMEKTILSEVAQKSFIGELASQPTSSGHLIKPACIRLGMESKFRASSKSFRSCGPDQNHSSQSIVRACVSENYFNLVANSFDVASQCLKDYLNDGDLKSQLQDVRSVYSLINIESGFHINAFSPTGAGGIGQFTANAISSVNTREFNQMRTHLLNSNNPLCHQLANDILAKPMTSLYSKSCERISIHEGNPLKNMAYTFAYLKIAKESLQETLFDHPRYARKFNLSDEDLDKVKRALMIWSHNAGPAGTWTPAKALLNSKYRHRQVTNAEQFILEMRTAMQKFPASANRSRARRVETARYLPAIKNTLHQIESAVGGESCVN